jgi:hypothetical protein
MAVNDIDHAWLLLESLAVPAGIWQQQLVEQEVRGNDQVQEQERETQEGG